MRPSKQNEEAGRLAQPEQYRVEVDGRVVTCGSGGRTVLRCTWLDGTPKRWSHEGMLSGFSDEVRCQLLAGDRVKLLSGEFWLEDVAVAFNDAVWSDA